MFRRILAAVFIAACLATSVHVLPELLASDHNLRPDYKQVFTSEVIGGSATSTSLKHTGIGQSKDISVAFKGVGTGRDYTVKVLCSVDEVNFVVPETGGTIKANVVDENWHIAAVSVPVCKVVQLEVTNNVTPATVTVDAIFLSQ